MAAKVELPELPAELKTCPELQSVAGRLNGATEADFDQIKRLWAQDRAVAMSCYNRVDGFNTYYEDLRRQLADPKAS